MEQQQELKIQQKLDGNLMRIRSTENIIQEIRRGYRLIPSRTDVKKHDFGPEKWNPKQTVALEHSNLSISYLNIYSPWRNSC